MLSGAVRRDPDNITSWTESLPAAGSFVAYCAHGGEVSQQVAKLLGERGIAARYLEGGIAAWSAAAAALDAKPRGAATRWITRERPKIDRIACPWLIARFIDAGAEFLYVPPLEVLSAAREKDAVPYDIPDAHFSHAELMRAFEASPSIRVGLLHGRMKPDEKAATMQAFAAGDIDVLVATTVIEVGVDVPRASVMEVVLDAAAKENSKAKGLTVQQLIDLRYIP